MEALLALRRPDWKSRCDMPSDGRRALLGAAVFAQSNQVLAAVIQGFPREMSELVRELQ
ncbi:hypothetical protein AB4Z46_16020 [Variovorax sp. M-6]